MFVLTSILITQTTFKNMIIIFELLNIKKRLDTKYHKSVISMNICRLKLLKHTVQNNAFFIFSVCSGEYINELYVIIITGLVPFKTPEEGS